MASRQGRSCDYQGQQEAKRVKSLPLKHLMEQSVGVPFCDAVSLMLTFTIYRAACHDSTTEGQNIACMLLNGLALTESFEELFNHPALFQVGFCTLG